VLKKYLLIRNVQNTLKYLNALINSLVFKNNSRVLHFMGPQCGTMCHVLCAPLRRFCDLGAICYLLIWESNI